MGESPHWPTGGRESGLPGALSGSLGHGGRREGQAGGQEAGRPGACLFPDGPLVPPRLQGPLEQQLLPGDEAVDIHATLQAKGRREGMVSVGQGALGHAPPHRGSQPHPLLQRVTVELSVGEIHGGRGAEDLHAWDLRGLGGQVQGLSPPSPGCLSLSASDPHPAPVAAPAPQPSGPGAGLPS